nr:hypothetical protein GCM10017547_29470 [Pseudarthrobacter oxydans]
MFLGLIDVDAERARQGPAKKGRWQAQQSPDSKGHNGKPQAISVAQGDEYQGWQKENRLKLERKSNAPEKPRTASVVSEKAPQREHQECRVDGVALSPHACVDHDSG